MLTNLIWLLTFDCWQNLLFLISPLKLIIVVNKHKFSHKIYVVCIRQRLHKKVNNLFKRLDMDKIKNFILNKFVYIMDSTFMCLVCSWWTKLVEILIAMVLSYKKNNWLGESNTKVHEKLLEPYNFKTYRGHIAILNLCKWFGYLFLLLTFPRDNRINQDNTPPYGGASSLNTLDIFHINKCCEIKRCIRRKT